MNIKLDWILSNEIAIGSAPKNHEDVNYLKKNGINGILSLCSNEENPFNVNLKDFFNCKNILLPDHKYKDSVSIDQLNIALENLSILRQGGSVYVHCLAGVERSPLVCMGWLVKNHNLTPTQALDYLMNVHPGTNPLPEQLRLLSLL